MQSNGTSPTKKVSVWADLTAPDDEPATKTREELLHTQCQLHLREGGRGKEGGMREEGGRGRVSHDEEWEGFLVKNHL